MRIRCIGIVAAVIIAAAGAVMLLPHESSARDESAQEVVNRVKKTVEGLKTLSCSFDQEHVWKAAERTRTISGTIHVKEPNKLRVEYPAQTIVVDGETVWLYIPKNRQVTIQGYEEGTEMFPTPYRIFRKYVAAENAAAEIVFEGASTVNGRTCYILHLIPVAESDSDITVWIDRELSFPVKSVEEQANGDRTTYVLRDVKLNKKIGNEVFSFEIPEGIGVVDMR